MRTDAQGNKYLSGIGLQLDLYKGVRFECFEGMFENGILNGFGRRFEKYVDPNDRKKSRLNLDLGFFNSGMLHGYGYHMDHLQLNEISNKDQNYEGKYYMSHDHTFVVGDAEAAFKT